MTKLLFIEWLKLRRYRTFWIILACFAFLAPFSYYIFFQVMVHGNPLESLVGDSASFSAIWYNVCYTFSHLVIFPALLMAMLCTNEFQYKTHRQNVIDGWKRADFYHAKWLVVLYLSLAIAVFALVVGTIIGLFRGATFSFILDGIYNIGSLFILSVNYLGLGMLMGMLLRRTGLAVILLLTYYLIVDNLLHSFFKFKLDIQFLDYLLPMESSDQMLPRPIINNMAGAEDFFKYKQMPLWSYAVASLAWVAVYYTVIRARLLRSDW